MEVLCSSFLARDISEPNKARRTRVLQIIHGHYTLLGVNHPGALMGNLGCEDVRKKCSRMEQSAFFEDEVPQNALKAWR